MENLKNNFDELIAKKDYNGALFLLKSMEESGDDSSWLYCNLAWLLGNRGNREEALPYLAKVEERNDPKFNKWVFSETASDLSALNRPAEAAAYLKKTVAAGRDDAWVNFMLGLNLNKLEDYPEALTHLQKANEMGRNDALLHFETGWALGNMGRNNEAIGHLRAALELSPDDIPTLNEIAWNYGKLGEHERAIAYYNKIKDLGHDDVNVNSEIGWNLGCLDKPEEAIEYLRKAEKLSEEPSAFLYSEMARNLRRLDDFEGALDALQKASNLGRDDYWIHAEMAWNLLQLNRLNEALSKFRKSDELKRDDRWIVSQIGYCLGETGKYEEALEYYRKAKALGRDDHWLNGRIGWTLSKLNQPEEALKFLKRAEAQGDGVPSWLAFELGLNLRSLERYDEALSYLVPAANEDPGNYHLQSETALNLARLGRAAEAAPYFKRAREDNDEPEPWFVEEDAKNLEAVGDYAGAIDAWSLLARTDEADKGVLYYRMGLCAKQLKQSDKALEYLQLAKKYGKDDEETLAATVPLVNKSKHPEAALGILEQLAARGPMSEKLAGDMAYCHLQLKQYDEALTWLKKAGELGRNDSWLYENMGYILGKQGKYAEAMAAYEKAVATQAQPQGATFWQMGKLANALGRFEVANVYYQRALQGGEINADILTEEAWTLNKLDHAIEALTYLDQALAIDRDNIAAWNELGWTRVQLDKFPEALEAFKRSEELNPSDPWLLSQIGYTYENMNRYPEALEYFKRLRDLLGDKASAEVTDEIYFLEKKTARRSPLKASVQQAAADMGKELKIKEPEQSEAVQPVVPKASLDVAAVGANEYSPATEHPPVPEAEPAPVPEAEPAPAPKPAPKPEIRKDIFPENPVDTKPEPVKKKEKFQDFSQPAEDRQPKMAKPVRTPAKPAPPKSESKLFRNLLILLFLGVTAFFAYAVFKIKDSSETIIDFILSLF